MVRNRKSWAVARMQLKIDASFNRQSLTRLQYVKAWVKWAFNINPHKRSASLNQLRARAVVIDYGNSGEPVRCVLIPEGKETPANVLLAKKAAEDRVLKKKIAEYLSEDSGAP